MPKTSNTYWNKLYSSFPMANSPLHLLTTYLFNINTGLNKESGLLPCDLYFLPVIESSTESSSHSVIRLEHGFFPIDWIFHRDQEQGPGQTGNGNYSFRFGIWVGKGSGTSNMNNRTKQAIKPTNKATSYRQDTFIALRLVSTSPSLLLRSLSYVKFYYIKWVGVFESFLSF